MTTPVDPEQQILQRFLDKKRDADAARDERGRLYRMYWHYSGKALEIPIAVVAGLLLGNFLDGRYGTAPWGVIGGLTLGVATAVRSIYRLVKSQTRPPPTE